MCRRWGVFHWGVCTQNPQENLILCLKTHRLSILPTSQGNSAWSKANDSGRSLASIPGWSMAPHTLKLWHCSAPEGTQIPASPSPLWYKVAPEEASLPSGCIANATPTSPARNPPRAWYLGSRRTREAKVAHITLGRRMKEKRV